MFGITMNKYNFIKIISCSFFKITLIHINFNKLTTIYKTYTL